MMGTIVDRSRSAGAGGRCVSMIGRAKAVIIIRRLDTEQAIHAAVDVTEAYLRAGAFAVGVGGAVANYELAAAGDWAEIGRRARRLSEAIAAAESEE